MESLTLFNKLFWGCILLLIHVWYAQGTCEDTVIGAGGLKDVAGTAGLCENVYSAMNDYPAITCHDQCYILSGLFEGDIVRSYDSNGVVKKICSQIREQGSNYGIGNGCNSLVCTGGGDDFVNANVYASPYTDGACGDSISDDTSGNNDIPAVNTPTGSCAVGSFAAFPLEQGPSPTRTLCDTVKKISNDFEEAIGAYTTICCVGSTAGVAVCPASGEYSCDGSEAVYDHTKDSGYVCMEALPLLQEAVGYSSECNCVGCYWEGVATGVILSRVDVFTDARPQVQQIGQVKEDVGETCPYSAPIQSDSFENVCKRSECAEICESILSDMQNEISTLGTGLAEFVDIFIDAVDSRRRRHLTSFIKRRLQVEESDEEEAYSERREVIPGRIGGTDITNDEVIIPVDDTTLDLGVLSPVSWGRYADKKITPSDSNDLDEAIGAFLSPIKKVLTLVGVKGLNLYPEDITIDVSPGNLYKNVAKSVLKEFNSLAGVFGDVAADAMSASPLGYVKAYIKYLSTVKCLFCCAGVALDELRPLNCEKDCSRTTFASTAWGYQASRYMDKCK